MNTEYMSFMVAIKLQLVIICLIFRFQRKETSHRSIKVYIRSERYSEVIIPHHVDLVFEVSAVSRFPYRLRGNTSQYEFGPLGSQPVL